MRLAKELKVFNCLLPVQVLNLLTAFAGQSIHHDALLDLSSQLLGELNSIRVNGHAVDTALNEELTELRIYARSLTADRNGLDILMSNGRSPAPAWSGRWNRWNSRQQTC